MSSQVGKTGTSGVRAAGRLPEAAHSGTVPEARFDRLVMLLRRLLRADAAVLALAGPDRVWFQAADGIEMREIPRAGSLFGAALRQHEPLVVADATADPRFAAGPLVSADPPWRFFAGGALVEPAGNRIAVLAALGREPRELSEEEVMLVADMAALAERELGRSALDALLLEYRQGSAWAQAVMDNVAEALITVGSDGRVLSVNRSAERMFARSAAGLVGQEVGMILAPEDRDVLDRSIRVALHRSGETMQVTHEAQAINSAGDRFPVEISLGGTWLAEEDTVLVVVVRDLSHLRREEAQRVAAESALRLSELRHTATFDQSPMGICLVSEGGRILEANPALAAFLERPLDDLTGRSVASITHADDVGSTMEAYRQLGARLSDRFSMEKRYVTGSGAIKWGNLTASAVFRPDGSLDYFVAMVEDINDRKRAEAQLVEALENQQRAIEDLDRTSKAKSYFVSLVGHEFRTALTGIQGFSELLAEQEFGPQEVREFAGEIHREGLRLTRMISEMLDLDRMESGRMKLNLSPVDVNQLVTDVVERFAASTDLHRLETVLAPGLEPAQADADKLTQVMSNLVANAIKYSPRGGVIRIATAAAGDQFEVRVSDQGLGVPPEALETIFERYARHESKDRELIKGTGLGLPVVRQIVEMHGGRVWVQNNDPERGATFTVRIPFRRPAAEA